MQKIKDFIEEDAVSAKKQSFEKVLKDFFQSGEPYRMVKVKVNGKENLLGVMNWGNGKTVGTQGFGLVQQAKISKLWGDCVGEMRDKYQDCFQYIEDETKEGAYEQARDFFVGDSPFLKTVICKYDKATDKCINFIN
jgi:hypothetical protein